MVLWFCDGTDEGTDAAVGISVAAEVTTVEVEKVCAHDVVAVKRT